MHRVRNSIEFQNTLEVIERTAKENNERNSTALNGECLIFKIHFMNTINFSRGELSLCHKNNCVNVKGDVAKTIVFGLAALVVISGIASMLAKSN